MPLSAKIKKIIRRVFRATLNFRKSGMAKKIKSTIFPILGDPGAASRDDAIFSGESLLQERKSPWVLILIEPAPEVFEFRPADWPFSHSLIYCVVDNE